jgi:cellobiose phosphorylase
MKQLKGKYGYFADGGKEYVITDWETPRPWINVISNGDWGLTISQAGGGYSWSNHAMLNRVTRWTQDIVQDQTGKYLFLKDLDSGKIWSITPQPLRPKFRKHTCTHGLGYTTFQTSINNILAEWTLFVPKDLSCETWKVSITNQSDRPRRLALYTYFELLLGVFPDWHREFTKIFINTRYDEKNRAIIAENRLWTAPLPGDSSWNKDWPYKFFFLADNAPTSFTCDKEEFFGRYHTWHDAVGFEREKFSNLAGTGFDQIIAYHKEFNLDKCDKKDFSFGLGILEKSCFETEFPRYLEVVNGGADQALAETKAHWVELCERLKVETPDPAVNVMVNYWLKYQAISGRLLGRSAYYQCGGAFGFRDQLQDSQVYLTLDPAKTIDQICAHAKHQRSDGIVQHWWHPISEEGHIGDVSDNLLWLPFVTFAYLNETDDYESLKRVIPYLDAGEGTLFEHCERAIKKVFERMSPRGLALIGGGDWNDGLNGVGPLWKGESIWLSHFFHGILNNFADLCRRFGKPAEMVDRYLLASSKLKKAILEYSLEQDWFVRATTDDGKIIGSVKNEEGKIFLNAQTWAVITGVVEGDKAKDILKQVEKFLYKEYGVLLFTPAYSKVDRSIGYLTRYAPGIRENGGVYTHAAIWAILAQSIAGNTEKVFDTFRRLCPPLLSNANPDQYCGEPYVTPGNIEGPESLHEGRGAWTWYSGSAAWLYKATVDHLLGVRSENGKLVVKPNLPASWSGFTIERLHQGKRQKITVKKPVGKGTQTYSIQIEDLNP